MRRHILAYPVLIYITRCGHQYKYILREREMQSCMLLVGKQLQITMIKIEKLTEPADAYSIHVPAI